VSGIVVALYAIEIALQLQPRRPQDIEAGIGSVVERYTRERVLPYDPRTPLEVARELRRAGPVSIATVRPPMLVDGDGMIPLGGASRAPTVLCNETGLHLLYKSDEHGFNNPLGLWDRPGLEIALIGDSFTHGCCVPPDSTLAGWIRRQHPATLNLGIRGEGPLRELASIREYLPYRKPKAVLWFYFENDITDLTMEQREPILQRYLEPGYAQRLEQRQPAIDRAITHQLDSLLKLSAPPRWTQVLASAARLGALRGRIGLSFRREAPCCDLPLLAAVLAEARREVESWGGRLVFVYLPAQTRFGGPPQLSARALAARPAVLRVVDSLGITAVDLVPVFAAEQEPRALWIHGYSHYTAAAYGIVAHATLTALDSLMTW
jgi:hypothetical protein